jgi:hypothetical protein
MLVAPIPFVATPCFDLPGTYAGVVTSSAAIGVCRPYVPMLTAVIVICGDTRGFRGRFIAFARAPPSTRLQSSFDEVLSELFALAVELARIAPCGVVFSE